MTLLFSYDIEDDRLRLRMANKLLEFGFYRLQKSVFLVAQVQEGDWNKLLEWIGEETAPKLGPSDQLLYLPLTALQTRDFRFIPAPPADWLFVTEPPNTLII